MTLTARLLCGIKFYEKILKICYKRCNLIKVGRKNDRLHHIEIMML